MQMQIIILIFIFISEFEFKKQKAEKKTSIWYKKVYVDCWIEKKKENAEEKLNNKPYTTCLTI